jgi:single-strand DNA-binding protein
MRGYILNKLGVNDLLNRSILIGRLTKDPELRYTPAGHGVATFTLAVDRPFTSESGEKEADFLPVVVWRKKAESVANYCRKGKLVAVEGRIQVRNYVNSEGRRIYITEIVADDVRFLEKAGEQGQPASEMHEQLDPFHDDGKPVDISADDLPF